MKNSDAELIQRVLAGDETAFSALVKKHQKPVHALAWRKTGDFHVAEEITQDTFLKAYQNLSTLKEPQKFAGWLYVIATNYCKMWLRKKRLSTQSLEDTSGAELEKATYSGYVIAENERTTAEAQREVVKKLLAKLQESERTVITLYYLGGMTYQEISKFLGVSVGTIKTRLYRARQRLKKEEPMIREALEHFQITPNLTENIMREVSRLKPIAPSNSKPFVPWAVGVSTLAVVLLMLGVGTEYLSRFQKPYSFDATSEMTVELIEAPVVLNLEAKPDVRAQLGNAAAPSQNDGTGQQPDEVVFAAAQTDGEDVSVPKRQWVQAKPARGIPAPTIFATPEGELYIIGGGGSIYKLSADGKMSQHIFDLISLNTTWGGQSPIAKWNDTLYLVPSNEFFVSTDDGKTWDLVYSWPMEYGYPTGLVLTDQAFYLSFDNGIFRSEDTGKTWKIIADDVIGDISSLVATQNTLFAGTDTGLYRFNAEGWERLKFPVPDITRIISVAVAKERLYVTVELDKNMQNPRQISRGQQRTWWIFRSTDLGDSWEDITPTNAWPVKGFPPHIKLIATGETLLAMERGMVRSLDGGNTWMDLQAPGTSPSMINIFPAVVANEGVIFIGGENGVYRSLDEGRSWDPVSIGRDSRVDNLIAIKEVNNGRNNRSILYMRMGGEIAKTVDGGHSWNKVQVEVPITAPYREEPPRISMIVASDGVIYAKGKTSPEETRLYRVSVDDNTLMQIQEIQILHSRTLWNQLSQGRRLSFDLQDKSFLGQLRESSSGATQFFKQLAEGDPRRAAELIHGGLRGAFAVSGDTFYMEYNYKLFRWEPGDTEWYDTAQEETVELTPRLAFENLKLAASGNTVYVGKRDGHLVVSFDKGSNWLDLTPALPFPVKAFNAIVSADPTVYVATDAGVITSDDGRHWHIVTDAEGNNLIMEHLAVDGTTVYGISKTDAYRLENGTWKQIASEVPERVTSLAVDGNLLYVGTQDSGVLHFNLDE